MQCRVGPSAHPWSPQSQSRGERRGFCALPRATVGAGLVPGGGNHLSLDVKTSVPFPLPPSLLQGPATGPPAITLWVSVSASLTVLSRSKELLSILAPTSRNLMWQVSLQSPVGFWPSHTVVAEGSGVGNGWSRCVGVRASPPFHSLN